MENGVHHTTRRLKLSFDANSFKATDDFSLKTLILVPGTLKNVSDLCFHILTKFDLKKECPNGITLSVEGFTVPPTQDISIVRENDVITVNKRASADTKKRILESPKEHHKHTVAIKKPKTTVTAPVKRVKTTTASSSSSDSSVSGGGYSSESETSSEESSSSEDSSSEDEKVKKAVSATQKSLVIPKATQPPKKVETPPKLQQQTTPKQQQPIVQKTTPNKQETPNKQQATPTKVRFDDNVQTTPATQSAPITPVSDSKPKRKRNNKKAKPNEDVQKNTSVILTNAAQAKPQRDYSLYPTLSAKEMPKVGDHIAFNMVELIGWQPTVSLKEADVLDINQNAISLRIHDAFITKQQKLDDEDEVEEEAVSEVFLNRDQLLDVRIIQ